MAATPARPPRNLRRIAAQAMIGLVILLGAIQLVPYRPSATPPPANHPFRWQDPAAEAVARAACYDCHSSDTRIWWAVKVAPFSWLARHDIDEARDNVDFSNWNGRLTAARLRRALDHGMPPLPYVLAHPEARLSQARKETLIQGLRQSLAASAGPEPALVLASQPRPGAAAAAQPDAEAIINARCSSCHGPSRALRYRAASTARAKRLIDRMVGHGARVSPEAERTLIRRFTS